MTRTLVAGFASLLMAGCNAASESLPEHKVEVTNLFEGQRVQVNVSADITREQCIALIENYKGDANGGQVSVHKPAPAMQGELSPWCYYNFDGEGVRFNDTIFDLPPELHDGNRTELD